MQYTRNYKHLVINALRDGGYPDDAKYVEHADLVAVAQDKPELKFIVFFNSHADTNHAFLYVTFSKAGKWVAEY
jgi:hypothetical protein